VKEQVKKPNDLFDASNMLRKNTEPKKKKVVIAVVLAFRSELSVVAWQYGL
jgi:hypothetical protein